MISMTGYGSIEILIGHESYTLSIKSVNSKQIEIVWRSDIPLGTLEYELSRLIEHRLMRGKIEVELRRISREDASRDRQHFEQIEKTLSDIRDFFPSEDPYQIFHFFTRLDSSHPTTPLLDESSMVRGLEEVIGSLEVMRESEGSMTRQVFLEGISTIEKSLNLIKKIDPVRKKLIKKRIKEKVEKIAEIDHNRLEQEMIYYIEKMDFSEEISRLAHHLDYLSRLIDEVSSGKKITFLLQELLREANTLGSKANESTIQHLVVEIKDTIEKLREQSANIL